MTIQSMFFCVNLLALHGFFFFPPILKCRVVIKLFAPYDCEQSPIPCPPAFEFTLPRESKTRGIYYIFKSAYLCRWALQDGQKENVKAKLVGFHHHMWRNARGFPLWTPFLKHFNPHLSAYFTGSFISEWWATLPHCSHLLVFNVN